MEHSGAAKSTQLRIEEPRIEEGKSRLIVGLQERFTMQTRQGIPGLWQRFAPYFGKVHGQVSRVAYGVCTNLLPNPWSFDYLAGVEVSSASGLPAGFTQATPPESLYAIFSHRDHVSRLPATLDAIDQQWLPNSNYVPAPGTPIQPYLIERYGEGFDPVSGMGDIEIWIPVERKV